MQKLLRLTIWFCKRATFPPPRVAAEGEAPLEWNSGSNGYVYFAAATPGGSLTQLPHVTPGQIKAARRIKKLLTGRLSSQVAGRVRQEGGVRR